MRAELAAEQEMHDNYDPEFEEDEGDVQAELEALNARCRRLEMEKRTAKRHALKAKVRQRAHRRDFDNDRPRRSNWMDRHDDRYEEHCTQTGIDINLDFGGGGGRRGGDRRRHRHHYNSFSDSSSCSGSDDDRGGAFAEGGLVIINNPASTEIVGNTDNFTEEVTEGMYEE